MEQPRVSFIYGREQRIVDREIELLGKINLDKLRNVRTPGAHRKQKHIPGYFLLAHVEQFVWYESRLEMMILKTVDHERAVRNAIAQPFRLSFRHDGKKRAHVPDFLILSHINRPLLVNVKSARYLDHPGNLINFAACRLVAEALGWEYVTRSEPTADYAANVNWLNGYRRPPWLLPKFQSELLRRAIDQPTIGQILRGLDPEAFVRPALFHLMWKRQIRFDSSVMLSDDTVLWLGEAT